jgi:hypothetical protein
MAKLTILFLALATAGVVAAVSLARPSATALTATVGPGFSVKLLKDGQPVTHLDPGDYTITVSDLSVEHDFHLVGKGVNESTSVEGTGTETWNVTFTDDQYLYFCDVHAATMQGSFTVGAFVPATTTTTTTTEPRLVAHEKATAVHGTVTIRGTANRKAKIDVSLLRATTRVAHKIATGTLVTLVAHNVKPGTYSVRVRASDATGTATASGKLVVRR